MSREFRLVSLLRIAALLLLCGLPATADVPAAAGWTWIWAPDTGKPPETVFFRESFTLPRGIVSGALLITADNNFTAFINGGPTAVATGSDWTTVQQFDVTRSLKTGHNVLAVETESLGPQGGLLYRLVVTLANKKTLTIVSDGHVKVTRHAQVVWKQPLFDDSSWAAAREVAPAGGGRWGELRGPLRLDPTRIVRLWDIRSGGTPGQDPYGRHRSVGDRMLLSASVASPSDMLMLGNAGFTLFQSDSDHLSTEELQPQRWDWHLQDATLHAVDDLGFNWCYFPHEAFPPPWYRDTVPFTRIQCLEHHLPVQAFSPWDPTWPAFVDAGYAAMAKEFGPLPAPPKPAVNPPVRPGALPPSRPRATSVTHPPVPIVRPSARQMVAALCVGVHGDYGEAGLLRGARVLLKGQKEDWLARFGNLHDHLGWWCDDIIAREDFRTAMLAKYSTLAQLNAAWKREFKTPADITYPTAPRADARMEWLDFVEWYQDGVRHAIDINLGAARKYFPDSLLMLPAGFAGEDPRGGNDDSLIPKLAAQYHAAVRSVHGALLPFADNAATMFGRLASASRFYGAPFWTEPPGVVTADQEVQRIFESVSAGATGYFDWADNVIANRDVYYRYSRYLRVEKPVCDVAMYYPARAQKLRPDEPYAPLFAKACSFVRGFANFDIVDDRMVDDGALRGYRVLVLWEGAMADQSTLDKIKAWVNGGGVLLAYDFGKVTNFQGDSPWYDKTDMFGYIQELDPAKLTERYTGVVPPLYKIEVGGAEATGYLADGGDGWYQPETQEGAVGRWTTKHAALLLPVTSGKQYTLVVRVRVPPEAASLKRTLTFSHGVAAPGRVIGQLSSVGDITYRFPLNEDDVADTSLCRLTFDSDTFKSADAPAVGGAQPPLGVFVVSVQVVEQGNDESVVPGPLPGTMIREFNIGLLKQSWTRTWGKGLVIYFPATRKLLQGYCEVIRRVVYNLSKLDPARRDALPFGGVGDGVYSTLFTDKVLFYNSTGTKITHTIQVPPSAFAAWKDEVVTPAENAWTITLEPHSIGSISFAAPLQELMFEAEAFKEPGMAEPTADPTCSPGTGTTCMAIPARGAISTRISLDYAGKFTIFTRASRAGTLVPIDVLVDDVLVPALDARAGQTFLVGTVSLTKGKHTITLRARAGRPVHADFVVLTTDPTVGGYDFALHPGSLN